MRAAILLGATAAIFALGCPRIDAQSSQTKRSDASAGDAAKGKRVFESTGCVACHGAQGQGTPLAPAIAPPPVDLPTLISYARKPTGKMPPVPVATASDSDLADVYAYLKSVAPAPSNESLTGNPDSGKKLFVSYGCYECHGRSGQGAATGPRIAATALTQQGVTHYVRAPTGQMPPYTARVVSDQDLADIYAFLKSFSPPRPAANIPLLNQ